MTIEIVYHDGRFTLSPTHSLTDGQAQYAQTYLDRASRYQVIAHYHGSPVFSLYQPPLASTVGARSLTMRLARATAGVRIPATATLSVTKACQCECGHCSAVFYNHAKHKALSTSDLQAAITQTVALGATTIILLGGEPLLHTDLDALITSVPPEQATVILFTNGEYLTASRCARLKEAGLFGAFISLDSPDEIEHDRYRQRPGIFQKAVAGIANLKSAGLLAGISSYLSPDRLQEGVFGHIMQLGKDLGVHEVTFFDAIPSGRWLRDESQILKSVDRNYIRTMVRQYRALRHYPGLSVQSTLTSDCGSAFCFAANTQFYLTAWGDMCPCDFTPITVGRFPDEPIATLWEKMITAVPYRDRTKACRMQDPGFRRRYIDAIPPEGPYPYPLDLLNASVR